MTNWFKGIDEALSTAGGTQVALAGYYFVDVINGDDSTGDGSPSNPWGTLRHSLLNMGTDGNLAIANSDGIRISDKSLVFADGLYTITTQTTGTDQVNLIANNEGSVIIDVSTCPRPTANKGCLIGTYTIFGIEIYEEANVFTYNERNFYAVRSKLSSFQTNGQSGSFCALDCVISSEYAGLFDNPSFPHFRIIEDNTLTPSTNIFTRCTFIDVNIGTDAGLGARNINNMSFINCDFNANTGLFISNTNLSKYTLTNCNFRGTVTNTDGGSTVIDLVDCIDVDPIYIGDWTKRELLLSTNSPLIGAGENGTTIGAFRVGELVDLSSPAENNDITVGATIEITDPATTGNIKPALKTFSQIRVSPIPVYNGLPDNTDNVPDNESTSIIPKRKTLNILYRETVGGADLTGEFLYGFPMFQDNSGNKTGEDDFDIFDISSDGDFNNADNLTSVNLISVAQIQENFVLVDGHDFSRALRFDNDANGNRSEWNGTLFTYPDEWSLVTWVDIENYPLQTGTAAGLIVLTSDISEGTGLRDQTTYQLMDYTSPITTMNIVSGVGDTSETVATASVKIPVDFAGRIMIVTRIRRKESSNGANKMDIYAYGKGKNGSSDFELTDSANVPETWDLNTKGDRVLSGRLDANSFKGDLIETVAIEGFLNEEEIYKVWNLGQGSQFLESKTKIWEYLFNETTGNTAADSSSGGRDMTLTNFTAVDADKWVTPLFS